MPSPRLLIALWCSQERGPLKSFVHPSGDDPHCHITGKREPLMRARGDAPLPGLGGASYGRAAESVL